MQESDVLCFDYRKKSADEVYESHDYKSKSSKYEILKTKSKYQMFLCCFTPMVVKSYFVPAGHIGFVMNSQNEYLLANPGMHLFTDPFLHITRAPALIAGSIVHGNRTIVVVDQGSIGFATDNGQPVILPPGIHSWTSETLRFVKSYEMAENIVHIGPYTILTVDEGYAAVTQNNGKQMILKGGHTHFLNHINWKFEKFMTLKVQTDELEKIQATSADNINMSVTSTVNWRIIDPIVAATMAAETMSKGNNGDLTKLRRDVLKQALASLAGFIGSVNYSGSFHVSAAGQRKDPSTSVGGGNGISNLDYPVASVSYDNDNDDITSNTNTNKNKSSEPIASAPAMFMENPLYDTVKMESAMEHANKTTHQYGVHIMSINIISASPLDTNLTKSLASGAVATAEALQMETAAKGRANAAIIDAEADSSSRLIDADARAAAVIKQAEAAKTAAILKATGEAEAIRLVANAISDNGKEAVQQRLAEQYIDSVMEMSSKANMVIVPNTSVADIGGILGTATGISESLRQSMKIKMNDSKDID